MSFSTDIKNFNKRVEKAATKIFRGSALEIFSKVILRTPVGNPSKWKSKPPKGYAGGRLRGNWMASINSPASAVTDKTDKSGRASMARAKTATQTARLIDSIYLMNNLPYAKRVEDGWSQQAPEGMVKRTIAEFKRIVAKNAKRHKR